MITEEVKRELRIREDYLIECPGFWEKLGFDKKDQEILELEVTHGK